MKFNIFGTTGWISHIQVLNKKFAKLKHHSTSFKNANSRNVSCIGTFGDQKSFRFLWESNLLVSKTTDCIPSISVAINIYLSVKSYLIAKRCIQLLASDCWLVKLAKKWKIVCSFWFPSSVCIKTTAKVSIKKTVLYSWFNIHIFFMRS